MLTFDKDNLRKSKMQFLNDDLLRGKRLSKLILALCEKVIGPLLNYKLTLINHNFLESNKFSFTKHTQAWLLPDLLN